MGYSLSSANQTVVHLAPQRCPCDSHVAACSAPGSFAVCSAPGSLCRRCVAVRGVYGNLQECGRAGRDGSASECILIVDMLRPPSLLPNPNRSAQLNEHLKKKLLECWRWVFSHRCSVPVHLIPLFLWTTAQTCSFVLCAGMRCARTAVG